MSGKYLAVWPPRCWGVLAAGQALLLLLLLADSFELAETVWGRVWRRRSAPVAAAPGDAVLPKVSIHVPICNEPPQMVRQTLDALAELDYPDFEVLVIDNNTTDPGAVGAGGGTLRAARRAFPLLPSRQMAAASRPAR